MRLRFLFSACLLVTFLSETFYGALFAQTNTPLSGYTLPGDINRSRSKESEPPPFKPTVSARAKKEQPPVFGRSILRDFDEKNVSWKLEYNPADVRLLTHERTDKRPYRGKRSELIQFSSRIGNTSVVLEHQLAPARIQNALKVSLKIRSNRPGARLGIRIVFPFTPDPNTGTPFSPILYSDALLKINRWQEMKFQTTDKLIEKQLTLWRGMLKPSPVDTRGMYIDRVFIIQPIKKGTTELVIDDLNFGPVISPQGVKANPTNKRQQRKPPEVTFQLGRFLVHKKPFFPIIIPDRGEDVRLLKQIGANTVWIRNLYDQNRLTEINKQGLWGTAKPPIARSKNGNVLSADQASLMPFRDDWDGILIWTLGAQIPAKFRNQLHEWTEQVRNVDRRMKRPIHADVKGNEDRFSRDVDMLSVSKNILNTGLTLQNYRDDLRKRSEIAEPGSFLMTLIQTDPSIRIQTERKEAGFKPIQTEPEQIRLLLYAALSAGVRGVTYWTTSPLDGDAPGTIERSLAISQLNLELQLLEPFLASSTLIGDIPVRMETQAKSRWNPFPFSFQSSAAKKREQSTYLAEQKAKQRGQHTPRSPIQAALFRCDFGQIVLPVWYDSNSQFVPGQLAANNVQIIIPGFPESAFAWEVSTTGIFPLEPKRVNGGSQLTLKKFDQTTAIIISSDSKIARQLQHKIRQIKNQSARICLNLARQKLNRVKEIDLELNQLGVAQPDASQILYASNQKLEQGERDLKAGNPHAARLAANNAMELTRILQRAHWNEARRIIEKPTATQHAIAFQSLPDFHRLIQKIGTGNPALYKNRLISGAFEDDHTMLADGWKQSIPKIPGIKVYPELHPETRETKSKYCLRLTAVPDPKKTNKTLLFPIKKAPLSFLSPEIPVRKGQIVHVSGWVKVDSDLQKSIQGFRIYDNLSGATGAIIWKNKSQWKPFRMIREVSKNGNFFLTIELHAIGDVRIDDLKVAILNSTPLIAKPNPQKQPVVKPVSSDSKNRFSNALEFWERFPTLVPRKNK